LQTLTEIAAENNSTTIFPLPIEMLRPFFQKANDSMAAPTPATADLMPAPSRSALAAPDPTADVAGTDTARARNPVEE
jgi:hypothetical protein